jgi:DNA ligase (NAD+)
MDIDRLVILLDEYNRAYRDGNPLVSDAEYDRLVEQLRALDPQHAFLQSVEPEKFSGRREVRHPVAMLSLEKAYTDQQLERFLARMAKEAAQVGITDLRYKITPKLDGLAARDNGSTFATRGNGVIGFEISDAFDKGVRAIGGRGQGVGEIVAVKSYFDEHLADKFEHPRNMVVGIVSSDVLNVDVRQALKEGQIHFVPYNQLRKWTGPADVLQNEIDAIIQELQAHTDYPMDGVVVEVTDDRLRQLLGATTHHYRWQIAVKRKGESAETIVEAIQWQVGRAGNITPVMSVAPVNLSGATIRRVTAHHAGMVDRLRIGPGARIEIIRSGEVIPKLERVIDVADAPSLPRTCPSCNQALTFRGDFLRCTNSNCPAQIEQRISHFFRTMGNADWFGIKTIQRLVAGGYDTLEKIFTMQAQDFGALGFGPVQSRNLFEALQTSRSKQVEDWRFLAALGIEDLGVGDSRRLLQHIPLEMVMEVTAEAIEAIHGFGKTTSRRIADGIAQIAETLRHLLNLGFSIEKTPLHQESRTAITPIAGMNIVFTGKMNHGSREAMQVQARRLGANIQTAVSSTTNLLVCGDKVGQVKMDKAARLGVRVISEDEYIQLIAQAIEISPGE